MSNIIPCPAVTQKHTCMTCAKKNNSLFNELVFHELELLEKKRSVSSYNRGEIIYKTGGKPMGLLCLNEGKVKITRAFPGGSEQIVALKKPVDFIDLRAIIRDEPYKTTATALEPSSVCIIDKEDFFKILLSNTELQQKIMRLFARELDEADERLISLTQKHLRGRIADALLLLMDIYGTTEERFLDCVMKRAELAALSNMTTANVIRTLSQLNAEGIIETEKKRIRIPDENRLRALSVNPA